MKKWETPKVEKLDVVSTQSNGKGHNGGSNGQGLGHDKCKLCIS